MSIRISAKHRNAFTLVELLVTITILTILATIMLFGMAGMQNLAKIQRTKAQIAKIHELIMEKWESYDDAYPGATLELSPANFPYLFNQNFPIASNRQAAHRLDALRELIRLELPDRLADVALVNHSAPYSLVLSSGQVQSAAQSPRRVLLNPPALNRYYVARATSSWTYEHESAECLYLIISRMEVGDASALELFNETEIGDTDGDGMPEILDAWGTPIRFIRWPISFPSSMNDASSPEPIDLGQAYAASNFDNGFFTTPLIVSAGPDRKFDIAFTPTDGSGNGIPLFFDARIPINNPFALKQATLGGGIAGGKRPFLFPLGATPSVNPGADNDDLGRDNSLDNISNHLIETSLR